MSATSPLPAAAPPLEETRRSSYWQVVGAQLRKNRVAMVAAALVKGLVVSAIAAPLLAFNVPLFHDSAEGWRLPLLHSLFDRTLFENGVDVFFNLVLVALPLWLLLPRFFRGLKAARRGEVTFGFLCSCVLLPIVFVLELLSALGGQAAMWIAVAGVAVPGSCLLAAAGRTTLPWLTRNRARLACAALIVVGLLVILRRPSETATWKVWRGPDATESGFMVFPPVPFHPNGVGDPQALEQARRPPDSTNWLGCDVNGRDVVSRILFGTRISLTIGLVAVSIYVLIGILLGSLAGYYGGKVDLLIMRLVEIMICFPTMFLLLTIIAVFETRSIFLIMAAIGFVGWTGVTRLVRGEFLRQVNLDYVTAAKAQGIPERRVIFRHVLPNCLGPVLVSATLGIAGAILTESSIAFLGLGDQTSISWGQMLTTGRTSQEWHLILVPGAAIFFVVTVFNLLGEGLRDALDPKLRR